MSSMYEKVQLLSVNNIKYLCNIEYLFIKPLLSIHSKWFELHCVICWSKLLLLLILTHYLCVGFRKQLYIHAFLLFSFTVSFSSYNSVNIWVCMYVSDKIWKDWLPIFACIFLTLFTIIHAIQKLKFILNSKEN